MTHFFRPPVSRRLCLAAAALAALTLVAWPGRQPDRRQIRTELLQGMEARRAVVARLRENHRNQFVPGFRETYPLAGQMTWTQGEIFKTMSSTDLAINGEGCFVLDKGGARVYSRSGRFAWQDGALELAGWRVQGFPLDEKGNICGELGPIALPLDPVTKLYGGKFTGFRFEETGVLLGECKMTDPVTGQECVSRTPLAQVALALPQGLHPAQLGVLMRSDEPPGIGVPGQGSLGAICAESLEMSNVDPLNAGPGLRIFADRRATLAGPVPPAAAGDVQSELEERLGRDRVLLRACLDNVRHELTPGYQPASILEALNEQREARHPFRQGELVDTHNPYHLAIVGEGYFLRSDGGLTRDGELHAVGGRLVARDGASLLGRRIGSPKLEPVLLPGDACGLAVCSEGELECVRLEGDGKPEILARLALVTVEHPEKMRAEGTALFPTRASGPASPATNGLISQGHLEMPATVQYEQTIVGSVLLRMAGLPPLPPLEAPEPGRGDTFPQADPCGVKYRLTHPPKPMSTSLRQALMAGADPLAPGQPAGEEDGGSGGR